MAHLLLSLAAPDTLGRTIASWKCFSARKINQACQRSGSVWQKDYFDRLVRDWEHFINAARYIRRNPAKAKLPTRAFMSYEAAWVGRLLG